MAQRSATLVRMVLPDHECPYGRRAKELLDQGGFKVDERLLQSREEVDAYKAKEGVSTTPQIDIDGKRIGGCSDLEGWLDKNG